MSKYGNKKVEVGGIVFDSLREARRYTELRMLERAGFITDLELQKKFVLIPAQRDKNGKLIERESSYFADFAYTDTDTGEQIVEDAKGVRTDVYILKRKLMLHLYGIKVREV